MIEQNLLYLLKKSVQSGTFVEKFGKSKQIYSDRARKKGEFAPKWRRLAAFLSFILLYFLSFVYYNAFILTIGNYPLLPKRGP